MTRFLKVWLLVPHSQPMRLLKSVGFPAWPFWFTEVLKRGEGSGPSTPHTNISGATAPKSQIYNLPTCIKKFSEIGSRIFKRPFSCHTQKICFTMCLFRANGRSDPDTKEKLNNPDIFSNNVSPLPNPLIKTQKKKTQHHTGNTPRNSATLWAVSDSAAQSHWLEYNGAAIPDFPSLLLLKGLVNAEVSRYKCI